MFVMFHVLFVLMTCFSPNHSGGLISYNPHFCAGKGKHSLACWFGASNNGYSQSCMFEAFDKVYSCSEICWVPGRQLYSIFFACNKEHFMVVTGVEIIQCHFLMLPAVFFYLFCKTLHFQSTNAHGTCL